MQTILDSEFGTKKSHPQSEKPTTEEEQKKWEWES